MALTYISLTDTSIKKTVSITDADNLIVPGMYFSNGTTMTNIPEISDITKYCIRVLPLDSNGSYSQELTDALGNVYERICNLGVWRNWGKVNGLGTGSTNIADQAEKLSTARIISVSGDATGSTKFDGSVNVDIAVDITDTGVTAAAYGPSDNVAGTNATTINIPRLLIASDGRITSAKNYTLTNSDCNVTQTASSSSSGIPVLLAYTANPTSNSIKSVLYANTVKIVPSSGTVIASTVQASNISSTSTTLTKLAVADTGSSTTGNYSVVIGEGNTASSNSALAVGCGIQATGYNQVAIGRYNAANSSSEVAMIIGNGTSASNRHNLVEVDYDGTITVTGKNLDSHYNSLVHYMTYKASKDDVDYTVPGLYFGTISADGATITEDTSIKATGIKTTYITATERIDAGRMGFTDTISYPQIYGDGTRLALGYNNSTTGNLVIEATTIRPNGNATQTLGSSGYRWSTIYSSTSTVSTSDETIKKDITSIDSEVAVELIEKLNPITYKLIDGESGRTHWGLGAQSVETAITEMGMTTQEFAAIIKSPKVTTDPISMESVVNNDEFDYGLRYEEFIAPIIKTLQYTLSEIKALKEENAKLRKDVDDLSEMLLEDEEKAGEK